MRNGDIIGAGGFGCIFRPPLKCKSNKRVNRKNVSKLVTRKNGNEEYSTGRRILRLIKKLPKYKDYFLVDGITKCSPKRLPLSYTRKIGKCIGMLGTSEMDIINQRISRSEFLILNIPYGGNSLIELLKRIRFSEFKKKKKHDFFCTLLDHLVELLLEAVVKMRGVGVYHNDLKADNILYTYNPKKKRNEYRIIDWGVSVTTPNPSEMIDIGMRPIQWNCTLSSPFATEPLYRSLPQLSEELVGKDSSQCNDILNRYFRGVGGHITRIEEIITICNPKSDLKIGDVLKGQIDIIMNRFNGSSSDRNVLITQIISHNIDIHGFISIFIDILIINASYGPSCINHPLFVYLQEFIWKYFYSGEFVVNRIDLVELFHDIMRMKYM